MKKTIIFAGVILCVALLTTTSCSNDNGTILNKKELAPVTVHVDGFSLTQDEFPGTRAVQSVEYYSGVKAITLAFYSGNTEVLKTTQTKGALEEGETFGEFTTALPMGSYTMVVIARGQGDGDVFTLTSPTEAAYTSDHSRETFAATQEVIINNTSAVDISATLNRIVAKLQVYSSDNRTANATSVRMTFATAGKAFSPSTGLAISNTGFVNTVPISATVGTTSNSVSYLFLAEDEQEINVTIETLNSEGNTLFLKTVENVPFKRNRITKLTGAMYTSDAVSGAFQLETTWLPDHNADF